MYESSRLHGPFSFYLCKNSRRVPHACSEPVKTGQRDRCGKIVDLKPLLIQKRKKKYDNITDTFVATAGYE